VTLVLVPAPPGTSDGVEEADPGRAGGSTRRAIGFAGLGVGAAGIVAAIDFAPGSFMSTGGSSVDDIFVAAFSP
jgi:hypothetical protein